MLLLLACNGEFILMSQESGAMGALRRHAHVRRSETARGQGARPKVNSYTISVSKVALINRTRTPSNGWVKTTVTTRVQVIPPIRCNWKGFYNPLRPEKLRKRIT